MNANPIINVAAAAARSKQVKQRIIQEAMRRQQQQAPGAVGRGASAGGGGGRSIFGGGSSRLPMPHLTRQSRLAPALIAALGMGGAGIPDATVGGLANGAQSNIAAQASGIPDWAPPPAGQTGAADLTGADIMAQQPSFAGQLDPNTIYNNMGNDLPNAPVSNPGGILDGAANYNNSLIHLGNGVYYDPSTGAFSGGTGMARTI